MDIVIGTRGSLLARTQSEQVAESLRRAGARSVRLQIIRTRGDKIQDVPLARVGGKGLFVKELEEALLDRSVDLAVHSLKDMPTELPEGLILGAFPRRVDPRDALILRPGLSALPERPVIGTSSLRRASQIQGRFPGARIVHLRGNVDTRLARLSSETTDLRLDAIVLAMAGLLRLGKAEGLPGLLPQDPAEILPAVGQGALAIECRADRADVRELLSAIHDPDTAARVAAERAFLEGVEGSCQVPVAAHAVFVGEELHIDALVASLDGTETVRDRRAGPRSRAAELGQDLARSLLLAGGRAILDRCLAEAAT